MGELGVSFDVAPEWVRSTGSMLGFCTVFTPEWVIRRTFLFRPVHPYGVFAREVDYGSHLSGRGL